MKKNNEQNYFNRCKADAELGNADAQFELGNLLEDDDEAFFWYQRAAEQGHIEAINLLGDSSGSDQININSVDLSYTEEFTFKDEKEISGDAEFGAAVRLQKGDGVAKSSKKAVKFLKQAAEKNHVLAQYNLGQIYQQDSELKDDKEAVKWFKKAAAQGYDYAQDTLGWMHQYGYGKVVKKDSKEAVKWYKKAAEQNHFLAQYTLGNMYFEGEGVLKDFKEAAKWYHSSAAGGYSKAELKLGNMYVNAEGVLKDYKEAAKWYLKCAEKGDYYSQYKLYIHANEMNIDAEESIDWLHKSAGKDMFIDIFGLLQSESDKKFIIKSYKEAVCIGFAESQYLLGTIYFEKGSTKDLSKSKYWINKAYENSDRDVAKKAEDFWNKNELWNYKDYKLKNITEPSCEEKIRDIVQNVLTFKEKTGLELSVYNDLVIGYRLREGSIILRDPIKAIKHFKKASKKGADKIKAAYELGVIYFEENSVQNYSESKKWIKKAYESNEIEISKKAEDYWNKHELWNY